MSQKKFVKKTKFIAATLAAALFSVNAGDVNAAGEHQNNPVSPFQDSITGVSYEGKAVQYF